MERLLYPRSPSVHRQKFRNSLLTGPEEATTLVNEAFFLKIRYQREYI